MIFTEEIKNKLSLNVLTTYMVQNENVEMLHFNAVDSYCPKTVFKKKLPDRVWFPTCF